MFTVRGEVYLPSSALGLGFPHGMTPLVRTMGATVEVLFHACSSQTNLRRSNATRDATILGTNVTFVHALPRSTCSRRKNIPQTYVRNVESALG